MTSLVKRGNTNWPKEADTASSLWLLDTQRKNNLLTNAVFMVGRIVQFNRILGISAVCCVKTLFFTVKPSKSITAVMTVRTTFWDKKASCKDPDRKKPPTKVTTLHGPDAYSTVKFPFPWYWYIEIIIHLATMAYSIPILNGDLGD